MIREGNTTLVEDEGIDDGNCVVRRDGQVIYSGPLSRALLDVSGAVVSLSPSDFRAVSEDHERNKRRVN